MTRIVVAGAGALGSVVGGLLARAGEDVVLLAHGPHAAALRRAPLELGLPGETVHVPVEAAEEADADVVILTAKRFDSAAALARVRGDAELAVSLQNGLGKNAELVERFGAGAVVGAMTTIPARLVEPGAVASHSPGVIHLGDDTAAAVALAASLRAAGIATVSTPDATAAEWSKLAQVAATMIVQALTALPLHELFGRREAASLLRRLFEEVGAVAAAEGSRLADLEGLPPVAALATAGEEEAIALLADRAAALVRSGALDLRTSMQASIDTGRRTELETIHGELVRHAHGVGVPVPALETCYRLAVLRGLS